VALCEDFLQKEARKQEEKMLSRVQQDLEKVRKIQERNIAVVQSCQTNRENVENKLRGALEENRRMTTMAIQKELAKKQGLEANIKQLRDQLQERRRLNANTSFQVNKTRNEAHREEGYVRELQKGLSAMLQEYQNQFLELQEMVERNNENIELLRSESAQNTYFSLKA